jgi:hypothetical protein
MAFDAASLTALIKSMPVSGTVPCAHRQTWKVVYAGASTWSSTHLSALQMVQYLTLWQPK